jgi:hypothetical protein
MKTSAVSRVALLCALVMSPFGAYAGQIKTTIVTPHLPPPKIAAGRGTKATPNDYFKYNMSNVYISSQSSSAHQHAN